MKKRYARSIATVLLSCAALWPVSKFVIFADKTWFGEQVRQVYGRYFAGEDWRHLPMLPAGMDYRWMDAEGGRLLRIGHALGQSGNGLENQLAALPAARAHGLRVLEVDLWLADDGSVRCFHGPGDPGPMFPETCTFDRLLQATASTGEYLVLDIKTDFPTTAKAVAASLRDAPQQRRRVIFQLYRPADVRTFAVIPEVATYAGPIVTAYLSRTSLDEALRESHRAGIRAFTFPLARLSALSAPTPPEIKLFVHPVHVCSDLQLSRLHTYRGIYTLAGLDCPVQALGN